MQTGTGWVHYSSTPSRCLQLCGGKIDDGAAVQAPAGNAD